MNKATPTPLVSTIDSNSRRAPSPVPSSSARGTTHQEAAAGSSFTQGIHQEDGSPLEQALAAFLRALEGKNRSSATIRAYQTDVAQFLSWLHQNNAVAQTPDQVEKADVGEYLAALAQREVSGVSRARKLAAIREYFRYLVSTDALARSPIEGFETPKKEKNGRVFLRTDEYTKMLSLAGGNPRDYAMLQVFLQTGLRVGELCNLRIDDVDIAGRMIRITEGKGMAAREVELEKKGCPRAQELPRRASPGSGRPFVFKPRWRTDRRARGPEAGGEVSG